MKVQENTALLSDSALTGTPQHVFLPGLGGNDCTISVHSVNDDEVRQSAPLLAEAPFVVCVICAPFSSARDCTNHPDISHLRTEANAGLSLAEEPNLPPRIIPIFDRKIIRPLQAVLSRKQAKGTPPVLS